MLLHLIHFISLKTTLILRKNVLKTTLIPFFTHPVGCIMYIVCFTHPVGCIMYIVCFTHPVGCILYMSEELYCINKGKTPKKEINV